MPSNINVAITAEVVDLQAKYAIAKAENAALVSDFRKTAQAAAEAGSNISPQLKGKLVDLAEQTVRSKAELQSLSSSLKKEMAESAFTARDAIGGLNSVLGAFGVALSVGAVVAYARSIEDAAAQIQHEADVLGLTTTEYQAFAESAKLAGVSQDIADLAIRKFVDSLGKAQAGNKELQKDFTDLGVSWNQGPAEALSAASYALLHMSDTAAQAKIQVDLMGRSGQETRPALEQWASSVEELTKYLTALGLELDPKMSKAAHEADIALQIASDHLKVEFTPAVVKAYGAVADLVSWLGKLHMPYVLGGKLPFADGGETPTPPKPTRAPPQVEDIQVTGDTRRRDEDEARDLAKFEENEKHKTEVAKEESRKRAEAWRKVDEEINAFDKQNSAQAIAIARSRADADMQIAKMQVDEKKNILLSEVDQGLITKSAMLQQMRDLVAQEDDLDIQAIEDEKRNSDLTAAQYEALNDKIRVLEEKKREDIAAVNREIVADNASTAQKMAKAWESANREVISAEGTFISGMIGGRQTLGQAALAAAQSLIEKELEQDAAFYTEKALLALEGAHAEQAVEKGGLLVNLLVNQAKTSSQIASQAQQTVAVTAAQAAQTGAIAAGAAAQVAIKISAAGAANTVEAASNSRSIMGAAYTSAAEAYKSVMQSVPPPINLILAPIAAAGTFAAVAAYDVVSAEGGEWRVAGNDIPYTLHDREAVMPAAVAEPMRQFFSGGGTSRGGDVHNHNWNMSDFRPESILSDPLTRRKFERYITNAVRSGRRS